jgi:RNA polymerase sigma-70 factor (ECF subfamily)
MTVSKPDTEDLLLEVSRGNASARSELLQRHQQRLRQMIAVRMDRRLAARVDPSDVVQDVLLEADRRLAEYLRERPLPFYPWLRQIAADRMADLHRRHIQARKRSVRREEGPLPALPEESAWDLATRLFGQGSSPSARLQREEVQTRVREALVGQQSSIDGFSKTQVPISQSLPSSTTRQSKIDGPLAKLSERDREVLVLRHLEKLPAPEIAEILGMSEGAVYTRQLRALRRLRELLGDDFAEGDS